MWQQIKCFLGIHSWRYFTDYYLENHWFRYCEHCHTLEMTDDGADWRYVGEMDQYEIDEIQNHPDSMLNDPQTIFKPR